MKNEIILFFAENGQSLLVLLLVINVFILSSSMKRIKERLNMLEICVSKFLPKQEEDNPQE